MFVLTLCYLKNKRIMDDQLKQRDVSKKKQARKVIHEKLAAALQDYKGSMKEKRFESNLKKASRLFAADLAKGMKKTKVKVKKNKTKVKKEVLNATNGVV